MQKLNYKTVDELAYETIKTMILKNRLKPGSRINQVQLARELGVSRTPIRRALSQLVKEHLLEMVPRKGIYVKKYSKAEMVVIFDLREVLEGLTCRKAAPIVKKEQLDHFKCLFQEAVKNNDYEAYCKVDVKFHCFLLEVSGIKLLEDIVKSFHILSKSFVPGLLRPPEETFPEHIAIIDALVSRDPDTAENLMRQNIRKSTNVLRNSL